jgi:5'-methylthioadenosine phosphorylase
MVTDYDAWKEDEAHVTVTQVVENLHRNAAAAQALILRVLPRIPTEPAWPCHAALQHAILTPREFWPPAAVKRLGPILARQAGELEKSGSDRSRTANRRRRS